VLLPPGKHAVRFRYQPKSFRWGATISGLALAALLAGGFLTAKRRRSVRRDDASPATAIC
jgi:hypothetical protein